MDSGENHNPEEENPLNQSGSFFMDGLTFAPGSGKTSEIPIPEPTDEFTFLRVLGVGGMGVVYEAEEKRTGRHVALKVIAPRLRLTEDVVTRFEQEAKTSASLSHPNCVFVYGAYRVCGSPAIAMELMSGDTLDDRIKQEGNIPIAEAVSWARQMLAGLSAAHDAGLIHRDIKPANVFIGPNGEAKIGDFGLTRSTENDLSLTQSGAFLGSPLYASPEQIRGQVLDQRTDIYSVGATLYALLAGVGPHTSTNIGDLFARIVSEDPRPIREHRPEIPRDLARVVLKALSRDKEKRFEDCASFDNALVAFSGAAPKSARVLSRVGAYIVDLVLFFSIPLAALQFYFATVLRGETHIELGENTTVNYLARGIFALYYVLFEGLTGASVGKRLLGLQVKDQFGNRPGLGRALIRFLILDLSFMAIFFVGESGAIELAWTGVLAITMRRKNGYRALHDFGSQLQVVESKESLFHRQEPPKIYDPQRVSEDAPTRPCGQFVIQNELCDTDHGTLFVGRDNQLDRPVWLIHKSESTAEESPADLHFLDRVENEEGTFEVYEAPGGASIAEYRQLGLTLPWQDARSVILGLVAVLKDHPEVNDVSRLWIGSHGKLRLLPFSVDGSSSRPGYTLAQEVICTIFDLESKTSALPEDIPDDAQPIIQFLLTTTARGDELGDVAQDLEATDSRPRLVTRGIRIVQILFSAFLPAILATTWILMSFAKVTVLDRDSLVEFLQFAGIFSAFILGFALIMAASTRGGLGFSLFGIRVVDNRSHRSSRKVCALRALLTWLPLCLAITIAQYLWLWLDPSFGKYLAWAVYGAYAIACGYSIWSPTRSLADMATGTHLVR